MPNTPASVMRRALFAQEGGLSEPDDEFAVHVSDAGELDSVAVQNERAFVDEALERLREEVKTLDETDWMFAPQRARAR